MLRNPLVAFLLFFAVIGALAVLASIAGPLVSVVPTIAFLVLLVPAWRSAYGQDASHTATH